MSFGRTFLILLAILPLVSCRWPRDPEGTLERVRGGTLRAGVSESPPWVIEGGSGEPQGVEVKLIQDLAEQLDAKVQWHWGTTDELLALVEHHQLDLVIGGLTHDTPWKQRVGLTHAYFVEQPHVGLKQARKHVMAVPPGENGWLVTVERHLHEAVSGRIDELQKLAGESWSRVSPPTSISLTRQLKDGVPSGSAARAVDDRLGRDHRHGDVLGDGQQPSHESGMD